LNDPALGVAAETSGSASVLNQDLPPEAVREDLQRIQIALDNAIPEKQHSNLLIATWNVRAFGRLARTWQSLPNSSPKRDQHAVACIAEIVSKFDVVALQEVRRDTAALRFLLSRLPARWKVIASDVTEGEAGNDERLAFIYDSDRVQPSGLVGEIVLPPLVSNTAVQQFARTPYAVSFLRGTTEFILTTVHVLWGKNPTERLPEIEAFAQWMLGWVNRRNDWNENLLVLGDFNLDRIGDPLFEAFISTGLFPPAELAEVRRTIFDNDLTRHFYDQIAWFSEPTGASMLKSLTYTHRGGGFDFLPHILGGLSKVQVSWRISDHYPLWVEFETGVAAKT
jgi:endonuclease/exonuclease/phosphatase family metal-dependent hydrolase